MSLKEYNEEQIKKINEYVKKWGNNDTENNELLRHEWIEKNSKNYRENYNPRNSIVRS